MKNDKHKIIIYKDGKGQIDRLWFWRECQYIKYDLIWFWRRFFPVYCEPEWCEAIKQYHCKNCGYNIHIDKCRR